MRVVEPPPELHEELFALTVSRVPQMTRTDAAWQVESPEIWTSLTLRAALGEDDRPLGWGWTARGAFMPAGWAAVDVTVAGDHEGCGVASALFTALVPAVPRGTTVLRCSTYDDDARALDVARHWGFEVQTHSINSRLRLDGPRPEVAPPAGVDVESSAEVRFDDEPAVDAMLLRSQTNPEARAGFTFDGLATFRSMIAPGETPVSVLARVDGAPAAVLYGGVLDGLLYVAYTGVDPAFRGRGLARLVKQQAHRDARTAGAEAAYTNNEERNTAIRRLNADLGYVVESGTYRLQKQL